MHQTEGILATVVELAQKPHRQACRKSSHSTASDSGTCCPPEQAGHTGGSYADVLRHGRAVGRGHHPYSELTRKSALRVLAVLGETWGPEGGGAVL